MIGSEYAGTFAALGAEVHLIDGRDVLMPFLDSEISRALTDAMTANGVRFHWNQKVVRCDASRPDDVVLTMDSGGELTCDGVLVCAGRSSNTETLNLAAAGLTPGKRGLVQVGGAISIDRGHAHLRRGRCHRPAGAGGNRHRTGTRGRVPRVR